MPLVQDEEETGAVLVARLPGERSVPRALASLDRVGIARDFIGVLVPSEPGRPPCMVSVMVPRGYREGVERALRTAGALELGVPAVFERAYGAVPHPGIYEEHDMKLPMGREYPETAYAPALSGYRVRPSSLEVHSRVWTFDEVELGYGLEEALDEAQRCLGCPQPRCRHGCPAHNDIPVFIAALCRRDLATAATTIRRTSTFPAICGRVCDKLRQCEAACTLGNDGGDAVAIGLLERFIADWELEAGRRDDCVKKPSTGKRVAIVGSGPSGLAAAARLAIEGHAVTVYEAMSIAGGALAWGIPAFRLPPQIVAAEIAHLKALGVEFRLGFKIGVHASIDDLLTDGYHAVFIGAGAIVSTNLGIVGEDLVGVYTATEFLSRAKLARTHPITGYMSPVVGEKLAVIGAGNTAMDVAQTAVRLALADLQDRASAQATMDVAETAARLGFREVSVIYRRSEQEMPARKEEVDSSKEEGVHFRFLTSPTRFIGDENGRLKAMECVEMAMGQPDKSGRREPVPKRGSEFQIAVDTVVLALGYRPEPLLGASTPQLICGQEGAISADPQTGRTNVLGVWAGGDIVSGAATVVHAMAAGQKAAADIDQYLRGEVLEVGDSLDDQA